MIQADWLIYVFYGLMGISGFFALFAFLALLIGTCFPGASDLEKNEKYLMQLSVLGILFCVSAACAKLWAGFSA